MKTYLTNFIQAFNLLVSWPCWGTWVMCNLPCAFHLQYFLYSLLVEIYSYYRCVVRECCDSEVDYKLLILISFYMQLRQLCTASNYGNMAMWYFQFCLNYCKLHGNFKVHPRYLGPWWVDFCQLINLRVGVLTHHLWQFSSRFDEIYKPEYLLQRLSISKCIYDILCRCYFFWVIPISSYLYLNTSSFPGGYLK